MEYQIVSAAVGQRKFALSLQTLPLPLYSYNSKALEDEEDEDEEQGGRERRGGGVQVSHQDVGGAERSGTCAWSVEEVSQDRERTSLGGQIPSRVQDVGAAEENGTCVWSVEEASPDAVNELGQVLAQLCRQWGSSSSSNSNSNSNSNTRDAAVLHRKPLLTTGLVWEELEV
jgi:hypothetical protein